MKRELSPAAHSQAQRPQVTVAPKRPGQRLSLIRNRRGHCGFPAVLQEPPGGAREHCARTLCAHRPPGPSPSPPAAFRAAPTCPPLPASTSLCPRLRGSFCPQHAGLALPQALCTGSALAGKRPSQSHASCRFCSGVSLVTLSFSSLLNPEAPPPVFGLLCVTSRQAWGSGLGSLDSAPRMDSRGLACPCPCPQPPVPSPLCPSPRELRNWRRRCQTGRLIGPRQGSLPAPPTAAIRRDSCGSGDPGEGQPPREATQGRGLGSRAVFPCPLPSGVTS